MGQRNVSPDRFNNLGQCHLAISFELYLERTVDYLIVICIVHDPVHPKTAKRWKLELVWRIKKFLQCNCGDALR